MLLKHLIEFDAGLFAVTHHCGYFIGSVALFKELSSVLHSFVYIDLVKEMHFFDNKFCNSLKIS